MKRVKLDSFVMHDQPGSPPSPPLATDWGLIRRARQDPAAVDSVMQRYHRPLLAYLQFHKGLTLQSAEDLLQDFLTEKIVKQQLLTRADPARGRFRNFLRTALSHFVDSWRRAQGAEKRTPERASIWTPATENQAAEAAADIPDPLEISWALDTVGRTLLQMKNECLAENRLDLWTLFLGRVLRLATGQAELSFAALASQLGFPDAKHAANRFQTSCRRFQRLLRQQLMAVCGEEEIITVYGDLIDALRAAGPLWLEKLQSFLWCDLPEMSQATGDRPWCDVGPFVNLAQAGPAVAQDFAAALGTALDATLLIDEGGLAPDLTRDLLAALRMADGNTARLRDILHQPKPSLAALQWIKRATRAAVDNPDCMIPREVGTALYFLAIAVALTEHGARLSKRGDEALCRGLEWSVAQPWIDDDSKARIAAARARLDAEKLPR